MSSGAARSAAKIATRAIPNVRRLMSVADTQPRGFTPLLGIISASQAPNPIAARANNDLGLQEMAKAASAAAAAPHQPAPVRKNRTIAGSMQSAATAPATLVTKPQCTNSVYPPSYQ